jgi:DNA primase
MCVVNGESRPDTKGRGGFNFQDEKFQYNCFNCGYTTGWSPGKKLSFRLRKLLVQFGADESDVQRLQLELMREDEMAAILYKQTQRNKPVVIDWPTMNLPEGAKPLCDYTHPDGKFIELANYLHERGFDIQDPRFMYTTEKMPARMHNRFIIPFTYKGNTVGYTARWIGNPPADMPKYYNKQPPKNFLYGLDRQQDKKTVILTEGILDAIVTDGIAIGSNNINDDQANIVDSLNANVILLPDADSAGLRAVNTAIERGWSVSFPEWEDCKDAADAQIKYGRLFTVNSILESAITGETKIRVMAKRYCK